MSGAETVNDEFEVGFNQNFESRWYRAEQVGRTIMVLFALAAGLGLFGRGPFSHSTIQSASGAMAVDYEPIARHSTSTTLTVHIRRPLPTPQSVQLRVDQHILEPMGYQHSTPIADSSIVSDNGVRMTFNEAADQHDALIRIGLAPDALGLIPLHLSDGTESIDWYMLVVP